MKAGEKGSQAAGGKVRVRILLLPPGGREARGWIEEEVLKAWERAGTIETTTRELRGSAGELESALRGSARAGGPEVILTVGRSGHLAGDFAPDTTRSLLDRRLPGVEERMYLASPRRPEDLLFRGAAGLRGRALVVNLPERRGRARTVLAFLAPVLRHALDKAAGDTAECAVP